MVGILTLAYGLRVWLLAATNLNWDEGYSAWMQRLPLAQLLDTTARDVHPPLYYLTLRATALIGDGEFIWRYGSVVFGVLAVAVAYRFGRALGGGAVGVITALLLALARSNVHISQLMRMHVLAMLLSTGALWATVVLLRRTNDRRAWLAYVLCTAGALYTFYLAVMTPLALNLAFLIVWAVYWRDLRRLIWWGSAQIGAALLFLPWALFAQARMFGWSSSAATPPGFFTAFYTTTLTVGRPTFATEQLLPALAYLSVAVVGVVWLWWMGRRNSDQRKEVQEHANGDRTGTQHAVSLQPDHAPPRMGTQYIVSLLSTGENSRDVAGPVPTRIQVILLLSGVLTPAVVVFLLSLPFHDLGRPLAARYMLPLATCFYALTAFGIVGLWRWRRGAGVVALLIPVSAAVWGMSNIAEGAFRRDEMHSIAALLDAQRHPGDMVILHNDRTWTSLAAHYDGDFSRIPQAETITGPYADDLLTPLRVQHQGIWLVNTPNASANDPAANIENWLYR
ncbi:MAG: glycosyltransferase family 39 protein, partial [Chloroflexota bacterium]